MDALGAVLTFTYSIVSLGEVLRAKRAMVKRSAKAHFFFLNMGCPSIEIEHDHLVIQSMKQFDRTSAGRPQTQDGLMAGHRVGCDTTQTRWGPATAFALYNGCLILGRQLLSARCVRRTWPTENDVSCAQQRQRLCCLGHGLW